ncbi:MAG: hypothetical protein LBR20_01645 [Propionibacteriaceae bacterium]|jgi:hypothetical protein|nr:hypothetical protein [Propionibacteriaceae bacterium]
MKGLGCLAVLLLLCGCALSPDTSLPSPSASTAPPTSTTEPTASPAADLLPAQQDVIPDLSWDLTEHMLWAVDERATVGGAYEPAGVNRTGFVNEKAELVIPPKYLNYDYCFADGIPTRLVGRLQGSFEVWQLDGTLEKVIETNDDAYSVRCSQNSLLISEEYTEGMPVSRTIYSLDTGEVLHHWTDFVFEDPAYGPWPAYGAAEAPSGTEIAAAAGGEFVETFPDNGFATNEERTRFLNLASGKIWDAPENYFMNGWAGPFLFLYSSQGLPSRIYTNAGELTGYSYVTDFILDDFDSGDDITAPYYWADGGGYQGYIDADGRWRYRENAYYFLED